MTWVDAVAIGIVVLSAVFSLVRGFIREVLGVAAWLGAAFAASQYYGLITPKVASVVSAKNLVTPLSIGIVFIVVLVVLSIVSALIGGLVRGSALSSLDRTLGLVFGFVRGCFVLCIAYIALSVFLVPAQWPAPVMNARLLPVVYQGASELVSFIPAPYQPNVTPPPVPGAPPAKTLMQQPVSGSAL